MDLVVLAKFVPDIDRIPPDAWDRERGTLIRSRLTMAFNPLDRVALRMALAVRAARPDTRIVALSMGPPGARAMLKEAVAHGADGAVLLTDRRFAGADTLATAYTLSQAVRSMADRGVIGPDFAVLAGMQSPDGDTAQVPAQIASFLDAPLYPYVRDLEVTGGRIELTCLHSVGFQRVTTGRTPFVATATRLYPELPFHVDLAAMRRANEAEVLTWGADDLDVEPGRIGLDGSRTRVIRIFEPERRHGGAEPLAAEDDGFGDRAAELMTRLRREFGRADTSEAAPGAESTDRAAGETYYRGDCVALCELRGERPAPVSFEVASACARLAADLGVRAVAVVPGPERRDAVESLGRCGIEGVWFVPFREAVFRVRRRASVLAGLLRRLRPQVVVAPATLTGRVLAPYVSARLDCGLTADCSGLRVADFERGGGTHRGVLFQTRPALGGNIMATIVSIYDDPGSGRPQMATVRPGALPAWEVDGVRAEVRRFEPPDGDDGAGDRIRIERRAAAEREIDLEDFEVIVCAGMGVGDRVTIEQVAEPFRAALEAFLRAPVGLGCSRAMVDAGVLPHAQQIGQTGIVVKPKLYVGLGVSGAVQHKIGMEGSRIIVSVNRDPSAPMHRFADHAIVGEVEQVLPVLIAAMENEATPAG
jgi:electron transfer flavoprotein alpha subunit/electron transfer flavoprotein alpha/beta subunit